RRVSREAYRLLRNRLKIGFDLVVLVYPAGQRVAKTRQDASGPQLPPGKDCLAVRTEQFQNLFNRAGLFMETR
ncbi:MAG: hypothetical protein LBB98_00295, partial [Treponema sp.]|nr:hypothetical protein [Treponema sp.]